MNAEQAFLQAIIEKPDDDGVRLIYADWLEENGQPERAEFIRLQIESALLASVGLQREGCLAREKDLLRRHGKDWLGELPRLSGINWMRFCRGFRRQADALFAATPLQYLDL